MYYKEYDNGESLYHFTNIDSFMRIVLTNQFLFNSIKNMNDINESMSFFGNKYNKTFFDDYIEEYIKYATKEYFDTEVEYLMAFQNKSFDSATKLIIRDWLKDKNINENLVIEKMIDKFMGDVKLCCFNEIGTTTILDKHLLWGHYAKSNTGIAIKFNKAKLKKIFNSQINKKQLMKCEKIKYEDNYNIKKHNKEVVNLIIKLNCNKSKISKVKYYIKSYDQINYRGMNSRDYDFEKEKDISEFENQIECIKKANRELIYEILQKKYLVKSKMWTYEDEYRFIIYEHENEDKPTFLAGINDAIEEIVIGAKTTETDIRIVKSLNKNIFDEKLKITMYSELLKEAYSEHSSAKYSYE